MGKFSRDPSRLESGASQILHFRSRCGMVILPEDLLLAADYFLDRKGMSHLPAYNRAYRAGAATRLAAVARLDLSGWRGALKAIFIALFSSLPVNRSLQGSAGSLIRLLYDAGTVANAQRTLKAYGIERAPPHYYSARVLDAIGAAVSNPRVERRYLTGAIATVAHLSALHIRSCAWEYRSGESLANSGYVVMGEQWSLSDVLTAGWAHFAEDVRRALEFWATSLLLTDAGPPLPEVLTDQAVMEWSSSVIGASVAQGDRVTRASATKEPGGDIVLTYVPDPFRGRSQFLSLTLHFKDKLTASLLWHSGKFRPSTLLRIEDVLVHESVTKFGRLEWTDTT